MTVTLQQVFIFDLVTFFPIAWKILLNRICWSTFILMNLRAVALLRFPVTPQEA